MSLNLDLGKLNNMSEEVSSSVKMSELDYQVLIRCVLEVHDKIRELLELKEDILNTNGYWKNVDFFNKLFKEVDNTNTHQTYYNLRDIDKRSTIYNELEYLKQALLGNRPIM